jgi:hypothetical protein
MEWASMPESANAASLPMPQKISRGSECPAGSLTNQPGTLFGLQHRHRETSQAAWSQKVFASIPRNIATKED